MDAVNSKLKSDSIRNVAFTLRNVKLFEIDDSTVAEKIVNRDPTCADSIKRRIDHKDIVTMIKSTLVADVDFDLEFKNNLSEEIKTEAAKEFALSMNATVEALSDGRRKISGT